jgi:hypothetical protein
VGRFSESTDVRVTVEGSLFGVDTAMSFAMEPSGAGTTHLDAP